MVMQEPQRPASSLAAFWRRGRKCFVPLTLEECVGAGVNVERLCRLGLAESINKGGIVTYHLSKKGEKTFLAEQARAQGGRK